MGCVVGLFCWGGVTTLTFYYKEGEWGKKIIIKKKHKTEGKGYNLFRDAG